MTFNRRNFWNNPLNDSRIKTLANANTYKVTQLEEKSPIIAAVGLLQPNLQLADRDDSATQFTTSWQRWQESNSGIIAWLRHILTLDSFSSYNPTLLSKTEDCFELDVRFWHSGYHSYPSLVIWFSVFDYQHLPLPSPPCPSFLARPYPSLPWLPYMLYLHFTSSQHRNEELKYQLISQDRIIHKIHSTILRTARANSSLNIGLHNHHIITHLTPTQQLDK